MHFGPSNRADRKTTEREGSTMCGGPLCTKTFSTERGGQKKKKGHGFGVSEYEEVLEPFTIVNFFFISVQCNAATFFFFCPRQCFPKSMCFVLVGGVAKHTRYTTSNSFVPDSRTLSRKP